MGRRVVLARRESDYDVLCARVARQVWSLARSGVLLHQSGSLLLFDDGLGFCKSEHRYDIARLRAFQVHQSPLLFDKIGGGCLADVTVRLPAFDIAAVQIVQVMNWSAKALIHSGNATVPIYSRAKRSHLPCVQVLI